MQQYCCAGIIIPKIIEKGQLIEFYNHLTVGILKYQGKDKLNRKYFLLDFQNQVYRTKRFSRYFYEYTRVKLF